ncbi:MAG: transcription-repair coupling factor [Gammaproteobacteria bacterium]
MSSVDLKTPANASPFEPPQLAAGSNSWTRLFGAAKSLALAQWLSASQNLAILVAKDSIKVQQYVDEIGFFNPEVEILQFPDWETLPYDRFSPYQDIISERLATLAALPDLDKGLLVVSAPALLHKIVPSSWVSGQAFQMRVAEKLDVFAFQQRLTESGYVNVPQVMDHGDFAVRGSIIDVFPMGAKQPFRIDLFDDEIETLRTFDTESQRSIESVDEIRLLPARETPLDDESINRFRRNWRLNFEGLATKCQIYNDVSEGHASPGIEYYLPLFFNELGTLFDYLPAQATVILDEELEEAADGFDATIKERYEQLRHDSETPLLQPEKLFLDWRALNELCAGYQQITMSGLDFGGKAPSVRFGTHAGTRIPVDPKLEKPMAHVVDFLNSHNGRTLFVAESRGRRETLFELLSGNELRPKIFETWIEFLNDASPIGLLHGPLAQGVTIDDGNLSIICENQLFGERVQQRRRRRRTNIDQESVVRNLAELESGAPIVHEDHGVGRFLGLEVLEVGGIARELIKLEYADGDKLYVPVASLDLISRYSGGNPEHAPLHKLGSGQWEKAKKKATEKIRDVAAELLEIYARREARVGYKYQLERDPYEAFAQAFPFEETPDQQGAIEAVLDDMQKPQPMDRLICGDVGFGKTEVAMRAAFVAINNGKQVGVLVPTTLLAQQHYQTFSDRFADWAITVEQLSRFRSAKEVNSVQQGLSSGRVDVVIGTHKLLSDDIKFKNLGLLIIDEEHRFGVRQKEKIKALRSEVDILTLTATPIPRTLNLALSGTRELSIIATPPSKRIAIKTFLREWSDVLIREAIAREISRGGQVYFVHNDVETIEKTTNEIAKIVPEARIGFAHGQMREKDLESVMLDFYHRRYNVLVCTTIIETGIDVPNANTIIVNRADKFGLAQLYQLRGRVGRSHHRAYAYLIVPHRKSITADAVKRLEAIESLEDLGVGFTLATHDMEIRGAGEILGDEQSGHIQEIGYGLYSELLNRAVRALKSGEQPILDRPLDHGAEIELHIPALLPEDYLPDVHSRLVLYKRISSAETDEELSVLKEEVIDRFGDIAEPVENLFKIARCKVKAQKIGIQKIDFGRKGGRVDFKPEPNLNTDALIALLQSNLGYRMDGESCLRLRIDMPDASARFDKLEDLLERLSSENG